MREIIPMRLQDGSSILVEVEEAEQKGGLVPAGRSPAEVAAEVKQSFEGALDGVRALAGTVVTKLREMADCPDEIEAEFGLKVTAEAGVVFAAAGAEANYKVTLTWKHSGKKGKKRLAG